MQPKIDFIFIDTEGNPYLNEIAIINSSGQLIYEAFAREHLNHDGKKLNVKSLKEIIAHVLSIAENKLIVCHYVDHDRQILQSTCQKAGIAWQHLRFRCTCELAKAQFPYLPSHSLEYLSKHLHLRVNKKPFNPNFAHTARYDAEFTYQLYLKIMNPNPKPTRLELLRDQPNPFSSSRVDTPFQNHVDFKEIYQNEFEILKSIITNIKNDTNHQSRGSVVIGEPGTGKTHLIMRLAKELLKINRLLFIRQPNNPDSVLYHTYSRILESFIEKVPNSNYTQLEHLLANSFVELISQTRRILAPNRKDEEILVAVNNNTLSLYEVLGVEGTQKKRDYWQHIEKRTNEWWINKYGGAGYAAQIIKGIVKFCSYSDPKRKELVTRWLAANELTPDELDSIGLSNWNEEMSKEEFSLQAISVFSKLSLLDEPLIIVFDQLEALELPYNRRILLSFGEAIKEIFTHVPNSLIILNLFPDRWQQLRDIFDASIVDRVSQHQVELHRPTNAKLKDILELKIQDVGLNLEAFLTPADLEVILNQPSIRAVLNKAADYYRYKVQGIPIPNTTKLPKQLTNTSLGQATLKLLREEFLKLQQVVSHIAEVLELPLTLESSELSPLNDELQVAPPLDPDRELVISYLNKQRALLEQEYSKIQIISDSDDYGKLLAIAQAFKCIKQLEIDYLRLGKKKIPDHIVIRHQIESLAIGFLQVDGSAFTSRLSNYNQLVINNKDINFILYRDYRARAITGKVGRMEIEKLNNTVNGRFILLEKDDRISFDLIYQIITDIQNRDLDIELETPLNILMSELDKSWIIKLFQ